MTREEYVAICSQCTKRKADLQKGLLCGLTNEQAAFDGTCADFNEDEEVKLQQERTALGEMEATEQVAQLTEDQINRFRMDQNLPMGIGLTAAVGLLCAGIWAAITVATGYQIGYMAVGVGAAVGFTMRFAGKGIDPVFGYAGAAIALISCLIGNYLSGVGFVAEYAGLSLFETYSQYGASFFIEVMMDQFSVMDLLFYGLALYEGYRFSFRSFEEHELT